LIIFKKLNAIDDLPHVINGIFHGTPEAVEAMPGRCHEAGW
jgi:hypothetical protein